VFAILLLLTVRVSSNGIKFIPLFMKINVCYKIETGHTNTHIGIMVNS